MKESDIRKYAGLMQELGLTGLEITEDNQVVRLERNVPTQAVVQPTIDVSGVNGLNRTDQPGNHGVESAAGAPAAVPAQNSDYISVKSPIVGVFYAAPAENADPFVNIGDKVEKGETLCIIEAMKLMNEIHADEAGTVAEICVANGQMVEFGTELFRICR